MQVPHTHIIQLLLWVCYCRESADVLSEIGIKINGHVINNLCCANDILLIATSSENVQKLLDKVYSVSCEFGLEISELKSKVTVVSMQRIEVCILQSWTFRASGLFPLFRVPLVQILLIVVKT